MRGTDNAYYGREYNISALKANLYELNEQYHKNYEEAVSAIEREQDPELRCILHDVIIEGKSYADTYGYENTADAQRMRVSRWIDGQT